MGLYDELKEHKYRGLPELAGILTNGNEGAIRDVALLAQDRAAFMSAHREWCEEVTNYDEELMYDDDYMGIDMDSHDFILLVFAYWLCGYPAVEEKDKNPSSQFGGFIDWKTETENIIWALEKAAQDLGYVLELDKIVFSGKEFTDKALTIISSYLTVKGYTLLSLDTESDCYHLFVIKNKDYDRLILLAADADFKFVSNF